MIESNQEEPVIIDSKFKSYPAKYVFQTLMTVAASFIILILLDAIAEAVVIASFGASTFIIFTMPHMSNSSPRRILGGNLAGTLVALAIHLLEIAATGFEIPWSRNTSLALMGSLAIGISMFLMVITNTEHPPASGLALGLTLDGFNLRTAVITLVGVFIVFSVKQVLKRHLIDLV